MCSDDGLTPEQLAEEARIFERLGPLFDQERRRMARLLASKSTGQLFGRTEYEVRERVHGLGAQALEVAADERQKKGPVTKAPAVSVPAVRATPGSSSAAPSRR